MQTVEYYDVPEEEVPSIRMLALLRYNNKTLLALRPETNLEANRHILIPIRTPTGTVPVRLTLTPNAITPEVLARQLQDSLGAGSPEEAEQRLAQALIREIATQYSLHVRPLVALPATSDEQAQALVVEALQTCLDRSGVVPVVLRDRRGETLVLLRHLLTRYDLGEVPEHGEQRFAVCVGFEKNKESGFWEGVKRRVSGWFGGEENKEGGEGPGFAKDFTQTCYGRYIDEEIVGKALDLKAIAAGYSAPCAAATLACGFLTGDWKALTADAIGICSLPIALLPPVRGSFSEQLRRSGELAFGSQALLLGAAATPLYLGGPLVGVIQRFRSWRIQQLARYIKKRSGSFEVKNGQVELAGERELKIGIPRTSKSFTIALAREDRAALQALENYSTALFAGAQKGEAAVAVFNIIKNSPTSEKAVARIYLARKIYAGLREAGEEQAASQFLQKLASGRGSVLEALKGVTVNDPRRVKGVLGRVLGEGKIETRDSGTGGAVIENVKTTEDEALKASTGESDVGKAVEKAAEELDDVIEEGQKNLTKHTFTEGLKKGLLCGTVGAITGTLSYTALTPVTKTLDLALPKLTIKTTLQNNKITGLTIGNTTIKIEQP